MIWRDFIFYVRSDLFRYQGKDNFFSFFKCFTTVPGFKYTFFMRSARFFKGKGIWAAPVYILVRIFLNRYQYKYGISIPYNTDVGPGFYIGHFGGIIVNHEARIGWNCNISHGVTIGATYGGKNPGSPMIGNNVYLGPGSKIVGGIHVGNYVAVGANSVVTRDAQDYAVVIGIPGKTISAKGSSDYVVNTISPGLLPDCKLETQWPRKSASAS